MYATKAVCTARAYENEIINKLSEMRLSLHLGFTYAISRFYLWSGIGTCGGHDMGRHFCRPADL